MAILTPQGIALGAVPEPSPSVPSDLRGCFSISIDLLEASRNCDAIATLSRFLNSATLRGGLLGRMTDAFNEWGAYDDDRQLDTE